MSARPHILITGATGFIGQAVVRQLEGCATLHRIVRKKTDAGVNDIVHDLCEPMLRASLPPTIDAVLHMAQSPNYRNFPDSGPEVFAINVRAMADLLDYAAKAGAKAFVHCSTGSVYEPYDGTLTEDRALAPISLNGATKLAAEAISRTYEMVFPVARLRFFMPYGSGQGDKLLPSVIDRVRRGQAVDLQGGTGPVLSPIHVEDAAALIVKAVLERWSGTYNVASPESFDLAEIAEQIAHLLGADLRRNETDGTPPRLVPETDRLMSLCKDFTFKPFSEGLQETVAAQIGGSDEA